MSPPWQDYIPDLPPPEELALEFVPAVVFPGPVAPLAGDLPLPPLKPVGLEPPLKPVVGLEPLLNPVVPLPGLRLVGFDPLLELVAAAGLALLAGGTLPGAIPGAT
jgi:hypothetical protein